MGVASQASGDSTASIDFGSVDADAFAEVFDNVHPLAKSVTLGAMIGMKINFLLNGIFAANIAGPVATTLNSDLFYQVNGHILDVKNFANFPGIPRSSFTLDAGMVPNGGVLTDFEGFMQVSVRFDGGGSSLLVQAFSSMNFLNTAQITSVTGTYNGQPLSDFTLTGDSGAVFPTGSPASAPEPGPRSLLAAGLAGWWVWRRRSKRGSGTVRRSAA